MGLARSILTSTLVIASFLAPATPISAAQGKAAAGAPQRDPLDINTATRDQLKALPGIGNAYADRIIKGRPYSMKNQLIQKGIIPENTYAGIQGMIVARRSR